MIKMKNLISGLNLHTICESARCPNIGECFSRKTATFLILGDVCTRNCAFCAVKKGTPVPVDKKEPQSVLKAVQTLGLRYVVITSVTRDDLDDGGASQFTKVVKALHEHKNHIIIELLIPDFCGSYSALTSVVKSGPHVINHNIETVPRLYRKVRPEAVYNCSLDLLKKVKHIDSTTITKSGLMVGLGETMDEVVDVMNDLRKAGCDLITMGQYLQPSSKHYPVHEFVTPEEFSRYKRIGMKMGFAGIVSAPLVRSSFRAAELYAETKNKGEK
jgi:lipoic acid synthetase